MKRQPETAAGVDITAAAKAKDGRKALGAYGEKQAALYLLRLGYRIVEANWRCRSGEIDLVAMDGDTLVFAEVRTRSTSGAFGTPIESVDFRKRKQIRETAQVYLHQHRLPVGSFRFDVIGVFMKAGSEAAEIKHVANAF
ncbi:YraN family protein [Paenibacillus contaminans]|uniref:YraN family protein n=1 Tax=Paenibacillus contaminans TaxID=450362 RepID=UPI00186501D0|nr:YraN family protein [Paenibacillus contaminans]